jgi:hypothetical protein
MARALASVMSVCLLGMGSVAVSGVSATAAPAASDSDVRAASVETDAVSVERTQTRTTRYLRWSHHNDSAAVGDIHLGTDFFVGAGGVGADPAFTPVVGGGGFAQASASASASASAHARGGARSHGGGHRR